MFDLFLSSLPNILLMFEAQIRTPIPSSCALGTLREIIMRVEGITKMKEGVRGVFRVKARDIKKILSDLPSQCEGVVVSPHEAKVFVKEHTCLVAHFIIDSGCVISNAEIQGRDIFWSIVCDDESFLKLVRDLEKEGVDFEILYKGKPESSSKTTYREEEILQMALMRGYFDFPKKVKLEELAEEFGIAPSTLSEIMRRGERKILESYFGSRFEQEK